MVTAYVALEDRMLVVNEDDGWEPTIGFDGDRTESLAASSDRSERVRTVARRHGWTVAIDDEYEDGARFVFDTETDRTEPLPERTERGEGNAVGHPIDAPQKNL